MAGIVDEMLCVSFMLLRSLHEPSSSSITPTPPQPLLQYTYATNSQLYIDISVPRLDHLDFALCSKSALDGLDEHVVMEAKPHPWACVKVRYLYVDFEEYGNHLAVFLRMFYILTYLFSLLHIQQKVL